ncbi:MAG: shikimate kinase [Oscillospiraceae bacterium]
MRCGLLGEKLGHSYSPAIHAMLGDYEYWLYEKSPEELADFLKNGEFQGLNVTIPYKKTVLPYCAELSDAARRIGSVNTLVRRADGSLYGDNTDAFGFAGMVKKSGVEAAGKKAVVLGSGGASVTVCDVLRRLGAASVTVISRRGEDNYENLSRHADAEILVNTTPVGMYPNNGAAAVDLAAFPRCEAVLDIIYNPARTALLLQAERLGIPHAGGLYMLVAQAKRSAELFLSRPIDDGEIGRIEGVLSRSMQNVVLVGMPGCGKSTLAARLGEALGREVLDADAEIEKAAGMPIPEIFRRYGEEEFRRRETETLAALGKRSGAVIATGGGAVLREENYPLLHQNGLIFWVQREIDRLPKEGRPVSLKSDLNTLYETRRPRYQRFADYETDNNGSVQEAARQILEVMQA